MLTQKHWSSKIGTSGSDRKMQQNAGLNSINKTRVEGYSSCAIRISTKIREMLLYTHLWALAADFRVDGHLGGHVQRFARAAQQLALQCSTSTFLPLLADLQ